MDIASTELGRTFAELVASRVDDARRLEAVTLSGLLDTVPETGFDRIASLASRLLSTPFGFITVVDDRRSFWKASVGLEPGAGRVRQNPVGESFCQYVIGTDEAFLVDDATQDERTSSNPSIESMGVRAWAGVPLRSESGLVLGTVCVVDTVPRRWSSSDAQILHELADIAADEIRARQTAAAATRSEALLQAVLAEAPLGFALVDDTLRFEMVNQAMADINGVPVTDHHGRTIDQVIPDLASDIEPLVRRVLDHGEPVVGVEIAGRTGAEPGIDKTWSATYFPIDLVGLPTRVGMIVADITERARSRRRSEVLADLAAQLGSAETVDDVARVIATGGPDYLEATVAIAGLYDEPTQRASLLGGNRQARELLESNLESGTEAPYTVAFRTGTPVLVADRAQRARDYPDSVAQADAVGVVASAAIPLWTAHGEVVGVMVVGWDRPLTSAGFPMFQLLTLGRIVGQAIERARITADRSTLVHALQRTLLSPAPTIPGVDIAVRYEPAATALGFGGDWYDVVRIDDERTAFVVGDVVGHDPEAAARMARVRTVISALVQLDTDPALLYEQAERLLSNHESKALATVAVTVVDVGRRTLTTVLAGHPPPLIASARGEVVSLRGSLRPWLGVAGPATAVRSEPYEPGSTLLLFTDGLVESRVDALDVDIDRLAQFFGAIRTEPVATIADRLLADFADVAGHLDDVAIIVARL